MSVWVVKERVAPVVCMSGAVGEIALVGLVSMSGALVPGSTELDGIRGVEARGDSLGLAAAGDEGLSEELGTKGVEGINSVDALGVEAGVLLDATTGDEGLAEELSTLDAG